MSPEFWTDLADGAIMLPLGIATPIVLALLGQRRAALGWTVAVGGVWAAMLVLKLTGYTISALEPGSVFSDIGLLTPSGHVASSAAIYGGLAGLVLHRPGTMLGRSVLAAILVALAIGTTRVVLEVHSLAEVVTGGAVGIAGAAGLAAISGAPIGPRARLPVLAAALAIVVAFHGTHTTWEETIRDTAWRMAQSWSARV